MRRALCVGIDQYRIGILQGCVSDAERMAAVLERHEDGAPNFDCKTLTAPFGSGNDVVKRNVLRENLDLLFRDEADIALFFFSGHGTANNLDGYIVTQDADKYDDGVGMSEVLRYANDSKAREVIILLDCCFSGCLGNAPEIDNTKAYLREGISILTASRADQVSVETAGGGVFTSLVVDALEGGAANILGEVSAPAVYAYVEAALGAWDQRPLFKSHVTRLLSLRNCTPPIDRAVVRKLPQYFPLPAEDLPLDPSYERQSGNPNPANVDVFWDLQCLNRVHLVVPVGTEHMYDAAMNSTACNLTPSGRYYWRLAKNGRI